MTIFRIYVKGLLRYKMLRITTCSNSLKYDERGNFYEKSIHVGEFWSICFIWQNLLSSMSLSGVGIGHIFFENPHFLSFLIKIRQKCQKLSVAHRTVIWYIKQPTLSIVEDKVICQHSLIILEIYTRKVNPTATSSKNYNAHKKTNKNRSARFMLAFALVNPPM